MKDALHCEFDEAGDVAYVLRVPGWDRRGMRSEHGGGGRRREASFR